MKKSRGFVQIPSKVLTAKISNGAKVLYGLLLKYAHKKDYCFPSQQTLASDLGISDRMVRTYLKQLKDSGLILIWQRGLNQTNWYVITARLKQTLKKKKVVEDGKVYVCQELLRLGIPVSLKQYKEALQCGNQLNH